MSKLIVVFGGTGTQGGSVISAFLKDPNWKIRTITRDVTKLQSLALQEKGVEVVQGDIGNVDSLVAAVQGANAVYGVTDFWGPFFNPATQKQLAPGQTINKHCYELEVQQGKNIVDAVATIADTTLEVFVWSSLADVAKLSSGKYTWVYHFDSKAHVYDYIKEAYPNLAKKTSTYRPGQYAENWLSAGPFAPHKAEDGVYEQISNVGEEVIHPWTDTRGDTGKFVRALTQTSPEKHLMGVSQTLSYGDYLKIWGEVNGVPTRYVKITQEQFYGLLPSAAAKEFDEMNAFIAEFGYYGGEPGLLSPSDLKLDEQPITAKEWIKAQDWSKILK
ncbi:hypothetical protein K450DRAFT_205741 [Umbelopsis ramanniana AG]|uniref:NmrA-like domain-containing protein n=1 Tax=Umbelopsis ramanniana AG TaxID=1314678 RepID=A0AAD5EHW3_UMBRA|nr:uncharacterized protein K450DRAFT_205741 [Umbelopsis ramanniana AG]KAI8582595.1 hypothetical protein K450DRAFT_205741 [Umbelopsis ramanniana AG]